MRHRRDIDGLRGVAVTLVVLFHVGIERLFLRFGLTLLDGGFVGVDVFYVLSGFLITGLVLGETARTGTLDLQGFYARRIRRLLPLASLTLVVTLVLGVLSLPTLDWPTLGADAVAASLYSANLRFALEATDYMAQSPYHSPLLHYWSLSVEEQFYFVWPFLLWAAARGPDVEAQRRRVRVVVAGVAGVSLAVSAWHTGVNGTWAFYGLHTRAWELAAGALLCLEQGRLALWSDRARWGAGLLGGVGVGFAALIYTRETPYPGLAAVVPVGGTLLLLAAGQGRAVGVSALLGWGPLTYVGRVSYAWYLWHWPFIVFAGPWSGAAGTPAMVPMALAAAGSFVAAALTHHLVEVPTRHAAWMVTSWRPIAVWVASVAPVLAIAAPLLFLSVDPDADARSPAGARRDRIRVTLGCGQSFAESVAEPCVFGDPAGAEVLALVGDSHAAALEPAFDAFAKERGLRGLLYTKHSCPLVDVPKQATAYRRRYTECDAWRASALDAIRREGASTVVLARSAYDPASLLDHTGEKVTPDTLAAVWEAGADRTLDALGDVNVVLVRDVPHPPADVPDCLARRTDAECAFSVADAHADQVEFAAESRAAEGRATVVVLDLTDAVCPTDPCAVRDDDGVIKYRDDNHLTATFSARLVSALAARWR